MPMTHAFLHRRTAAALATAMLLAGCSLTGGDPTPQPSGGRDSTVVLVTHESFKLPKKLITRFEQDSGYTLDIRSAGDAGTLTNKLVLTQQSPTGDVAFGVDNSFASRALDSGVFEKSDVSLPAGADAYALPGGSEELKPIDSSSVCVNVDKPWFAEHHLAQPRTLADLVKPAYRDLMVIPAAPTSSPGMAFLLATIAEYGDGWPDYWAELMANGAELTAGWSDAYFVDFTQGGGDGTRPIVVSYDSSPAFTVGEDGRSTTRALLSTCFRQVEYAGTLAGTDNPEGARAVLEFLLSEDVQAALPESMYVFPVRDGIALPPDWARFARQPSSPYTVAPDEITAQRDDWLTTWTEVTSR